MKIISKSGKRKNSIDFTILRWLVISQIALDCVMTSEGGSRGGLCVLPAQNDMGN